MTTPISADATSATPTVRIEEAHRIFKAHAAGKCLECQAAPVTRNDHLNLELDIVVSKWTCPNGHQATATGIPFCAWHTSHQDKWEDKAARLRAKEKSIRCPSCGAASLEAEESGGRILGTANHFWVQCKVLGCDMQPNKRKIERSIWFTLYSGMRSVVLLVIVLSLALLTTYVIGGFYGGPSPLEWVRSLLNKNTSSEKDGGSSSVPAPTSSAPVSPTSASVDHGKKCIVFLPNDKIGKPPAAKVVDCSDLEGRNTSRPKASFPASVIAAKSAQVIAIQIKNPPAEWNVGPADEYYVVFSEWFGFGSFWDAHKYLLDLDAGVDDSGVFVFDEAKEELSDAGERVIRLFGRVVSMIELKEAANANRARWPLMGRGAPPGASAPIEQESPAEQKAHSELSGICLAAVGACRSVWAWIDGTDIRPGVIVLTALPTGNIGTDYVAPANGKNTTRLYKQCVNDEIHKRFISPYQGRPVVKTCNR